MSIIKKYITKNIFISSTFIDMQLERDILAKRVLPLVKEFALRYYINIEFVDLRFGIDIGNKNLLDKVINTCSDEIIRCKPLFISFLGNRFGTEIENTTESITSFEIHKAINENCESLFYFRNIKNKEELKENKELYYYNDEKVNSLKNELLAKYPNSCKSYNAYYDKNNNELIIDNSFIDMLVNDINNLIEKLYKNDTINSSLPHYNYLSYLHKDYIDIDEDADYFLSKIFNFEEKIDLFLGLNGSGKSSLIANLAKENEIDTLILPFYTEVSNDLSLINLLNTFIEMIKNHLNLEYEYISNEEEAVRLFYNLLSKINNKCMIIIDDFKYIKDGDKYDKYSWIRLDDISNNIRILISTSSGYDAEQLELDSYIWHASMVNHRICKKYLDGYLIKINQRVSDEFYNVLFDELIKKVNNKPIMYLKLYLDYIFFNDRHDASIINKLSKEVNDNNLTNVDKAVLDFYTNKIKKMSDILDDLLPEFINKKLELLDNDLGNLIIYLIVSMNNGIKEQDINEIAKLLNIKYVTNEFAYLRKILPAYFYQQADGSWIMPNYSTKNSLKAHYFKNIEYANEVNDAVLKYLIALDDSNEFKLQNIMALLYDNNMLDEFKKILLYMIANNKASYVDDLLLNLIYRKRDYDLLIYLIYGYHTNKQEIINWYIINLLCKYAFIDYEVFRNEIPYEIVERIDSSSKGFCYALARINLELCIINNDDTHLEYLDEEFIDLYFKTKNINVKYSIIECYFKMIDLAYYKNDKRKLIKGLFKLLNDIKDKNKNYYDNLCLTNIKNMKLNKNNYNLIISNINYAIDYILNNYVDYKIVDEAIDVLFGLCIYEFSNNNYNNSNSYLELIKNISSKYRYNTRAAEALKKSLIIDFFELIFKAEKIELEEIDNLWYKFDNLDRISYEKELECSCDYYLRATEVFKYIINLDYKMLLISINSLANRINKYDTNDYEIYTLAYMTLELIKLANNINDDMLIKALKKIYKLLGLNEYRYDPFVLKCRKNVNSYLAKNNNK